MYELWRVDFSWYINKKNLERASFTEWKVLQSSLPPICSLIRHLILVIKWLFTLHAASELLIILKTSCKHSQRQCQMHQGVTINKLVVSDSWAYYVLLINTQFARGPIQGYLLISTSWVMHPLAMYQLESYIEAH